MTKAGPDQRNGEHASRSSAAELIGGLFSVDFGRPLPLLGAGIPAFGVRDRAGCRNELVALQSPRNTTPRMQTLSALSSFSIDRLATPLAHGTAPASDGSAAHFVVCIAPIGTPLGGAETVERRWTEAELIACVLRPVAATLTELAARGVTHRSICPRNVFQSVPGQPVSLGAAWAAAPASMLPAAFVPPYAASCLVSGRGEGIIADDVYALGVLLLALASGELPLVGLPGPEVVRCMLTQGSFAALTAGMRPPPAIADLARSMLAEDPDHRPTPASLSNPQAVRSRRLAVRPAPPVKPSGRSSSKATRSITRVPWPGRSQLIRRRRYGSCVRAWWISGCGAS